MADAPQWSRIVNTTIRNYLKETEDNILRNRKLSALMKKKGRIEFDVSGTQLDWKVKYRREALTPYADGDTLTFSRQDQYKTATLGWRGYSVTNSMTKGEQLQNRGAQAIVKIATEIATDLIDDMEDAFGEEWYIDGNAAGNTKRIHGIESYFGNSGVYSPGSANTGVGAPSDTYAGLSTALGAYGGSWSGNWPNGQGDAQFDFFSPTIVDYGNPIFDPTTHTWANNCVEAVSLGLIRSMKSKSKKGMLDLVLMEGEMFRLYKTALRTKERIMVDRDKSTSGLVEMGFQDIINQDGVDLTWEYGITSGLGYGFNFDEMTLASQQKQLFVADGPDWDPSTKSFRYAVDFFGNLRANPRFQLKFMNLTNPSDTA